MTHREWNFEQIANWMGIGHGGNYGINGCARLNSSWIRKNIDSIPDPKSGTLADSWIQDVQVKFDSNGRKKNGPGSTWKKQQVKQLTKKEEEIAWKIVKETNNGIFNQCNTASGLFNERARKMAIDLIFEHDLSSIEFIELKINRSTGNTDTPFVAMAELFNYAMLFFFTRKEGFLPQEETKWVQNITKLQLSLLVPESAKLEGFNRCAKWFQDEINYGVEKMGQHARVEYTGMFTLACLNSGNEWNLNNRTFLERPV